MHPVRAWLRTTKLVRTIKSYPVLYRMAVRAWDLGRAVKTHCSTPVTFVLSPFLFLLFVLALLPNRRPVLREDNEPLSITMLVISEVFRDPRVERQARALVAGGFQVRILYPDYFSVYHKLAPLDWGPGITFVPLPHYHSAFIFRFPYLLGFNFLRQAIRERPFAFHAHDLSTSIVGLAAAKYCGVPCVCDFHEWYSENVTWNAKTLAYEQHPSYVAMTYRLAERIVLRNATAVVTVCDAIANELKAMGNGTREIVVIRNIPATHSVVLDGSLPSLRRELGIPDDKFLLLYQGGTGPTRLIESIIEAMLLVPRAVLVVRGPGMEYYGPGYEKLASKLGVADRVICLPPVPSHLVVLAASGADAGIWTLPNLCKNFCYALPNKVFEYMAAGLPLLVADYPETGHLVTHYKIGLTFDPYSTPSIAGAINRLIDDPAFRASCARNTVSALSNMQADNEWQKLTSLYKDLAAGITPEDRALTGLLARSDDGGLAHRYDR